MSVMTDTSLRAIVEPDKAKWDTAEDLRRDKVLIEPFNEDRLTPVGYDVTVGARVIRMHRTIHDVELAPKQSFNIGPGEIVAIETEEFVGMPQNRRYSGLLVSKVSVAERGFSHISTSLDADYTGKMIITMTNVSGRTLSLFRGQAFCTVVFLTNERAASKGCGKNPSEHMLKLIRDWQLLRRRNALRWFTKAVPSVLFLGFLLWKYYTNGTVAQGEVGLFVAMSSFSFVLLDKALPTD